MDRELGDGGEDGPWAHALDWEGDFVKFELATNDHTTNLLNQVFQGVSVLRQSFLVIKGKPTILMGICSSVVISQRNSLQVSSNPDNLCLPYRINDA